jgi:hypothetical protein
MRNPHKGNTRIGSSNQHTFAEIPRADIRRSTFDRSHGLKTTFNAGQLIPILAEEAIPGDSFSCNMTGFARLATPIHPTMDNAFFDTHYFAIPLRLIWDDFEEFMGETKTYTASGSPSASNPLPETPDFTAAIPVVPTITSGGSGEAENSLSDYLTIPTKVPGLKFSALWHRAYQLVYQDWFRDENLQKLPDISTASGNDTTTYPIRNRGKRHDYFTSALPWPQKGADVTIPIGTSAPVASLAPDDGILTIKNTGLGSGDYYMNAANQQLLQNNNEAGNDDNMLFADLSSATAATINSLRLAFATQRFLEIQARGGSRYIEVIKNHFNVTSPDARLQRPEFLGSGTSPVNITPVAQTSSTDTTTPQGNLSSIGTTVMSGHSFTKSFTEHSIILGLVSVRTDLTYQQGLNRQFSRETIYDYYWPTLATIGEQAVLNKEIYAQGSNNLAEDAASWGFQERYSEYKYKPSAVTGRFRSNATTSLDSWHYAQEYSSLPHLGADWIQVTDDNVQRTLAVASEPQFIFDCLFKIKATRPMALYNVPGGTHF